MVHRINIFLLSIILALAPAYASANASLGGWTITNQIAQGASTIINATKSGIENGVNIVKTSTAKITPNASQVAKVLRGGAAGYALSIAVEQLIGSVDWVLDPANNQIKYYPQGNFVYVSSYAGMDLSVQYSTLTQLCAAALAAAKIKWQGAQTYGIKNNQCYVYYGSESAYDFVPFHAIEVQPEQRTIPLDVVAAQVINNAESHPEQEKKVGSQSATTAAAQDMLVNDAATQSDVETQLNTNAKTQTNEQATGNTKPNEANPDITDITLAFPAFCGWAPSVCQAANVVINFPTTLTNWWNTANNKAESWAQSIKEAWTATKEWMNEEETPQQTTEVEIDQTVPAVPDNQYFNWGAYCPFTPGSQTISLEDTNAPIDYDLTSWCDMATDIRPFVLAAGALMSFLIASGIIMGRDD